VITPFALRELNCRSPDVCSNFCQALLNGRGKGLRCLAASVNLILHHNIADLHTAVKLFAHDGRCKTFDASADGYERGEGAGAVLMRHASEARPAIYRSPRHRIPCNSRNEDPKCVSMIARRVHVIVLKCKLPTGVKHVG